MNKPTRLKLRPLALALLLGSLLACQGATEDGKIYYAIASDGIVYGYVERTVQSGGDLASPEIIVREEIRSISTALGMTLNTEVRSEYRIDPTTGRFSSYEVETDQESVQFLVSAAIDGDTAHITQNMGGGTKEVKLRADGILTDYTLFPRLHEDFSGTGLEQKRYQILDLFDREYHETEYSFLGTETLTLAGQTHETIVLVAVNREIGAKSRIWLDRDTGILVQSEIPGLMTTSLTDRSVKSRLRRFNRDAHIYSPAGVMIQDFENLSFMKVEATLDPIGSWITPESLNVRGQSFTGTVEDNLVQGTFEISHARYDGRNPPPFPDDHVDNKDLAPYVLPEDLIESADPVLVEKAREITDGAADSWDAAKRLSSWVAEEIGYGIPGGGSARNTYDLRQGECGAHSRLFAALCRAVGIPARVVWGCMYVPNNNGNFGQHAWNEVFMGEAGWLPIDTTLREIDYCDSGHIRLSILDSKHISYNPQEFEIRDFRAGSQNFADTADKAPPARYRPYLGRYQGPERAFTVLVQNGRLAVDIPGRMTFELRDPDEQGRWYAAITRQLQFSFQENSSGQVTGMTLLNTPQIPKKETEAQDNSGIPEEYRPYCGIYPIPGQGDISVFYRNRQLSIKLPPNHVVDLEGPDEEGMWSRPDNQSDKFSFVKDEGGIVRAIVIHESVSLTKID
ncbi:MAG: transglutaminase-like domain-containing protein [Candidatus Aminicenantaceae bacterium]